MQTCDQKHSLQFGALLWCFGAINARLRAWLKAQACQEKLRLGCQHVKEISMMLTCAEHD